MITKTSMELTKQAFPDPLQSFSQPLPGPNLRKRRVPRRRKWGGNPQPGMNQTGAMGGRKWPKMSLKNLGIMGGIGLGVAGTGYLLNKLHGRLTTPRSPTVQGTTMMQRYGSPREMPPPIWMDTFGGYDGFPKQAARLIPMRRLGNQAQGQKAQQRKPRRTRRTGRVQSFQQAPSTPAKSKRPFSLKNIAIAGGAGLGLAGAGALLNNAYQKQFSYEALVNKNRDQKPAGIKTANIALDRKLVRRFFGTPSQGGVGGDLLKTKSQLDNLLRTYAAKGGGAGQTAKAYANRIDEAITQSALQNTPLMETLRRKAALRRRKLRERVVGL